MDTLLLHLLLLLYLLLLPDASTTTRIFWGYSLVAGMLPLGCHLLQNSRLAVVFDLDETLVQSHSEATLKRVIEKVERSRCVRLAGTDRGDGGQRSRV
jgi:hypothetical protein